MNDKEIQRIRECELGLRIMRLQAEVARLKEENILLRGQKNLLANSLAEYHGSTVPQVLLWLDDKALEAE